MNDITVLIIGEDTEFTTAAEALLLSDTQVDRVLWAVDLQSALSQTTCHNPGLIISDLALSSIETILQELKCSNSSPFILMTCYYDNCDYLKLAREYGAHAFCIKDHLKEALKYLIPYIEKGIVYSVLKNKFYILNS